MNKDLKHELNKKPENPKMNDLSINPTYVSVKHHFRMKK